MSVNHETTKYSNYSLTALRLGVASGIFFQTTCPIVAIQRKRQTLKRIEARLLEVGAEDDGIFST